MKKFLCIFFLFFSSGAAAEEPLVTDRPDAAESSLTVGKTRLQLETSFSFEHDAGGGTTTNAYNFPTLLRFGLIEWLEFRIESPMGQFHKQTGQAHSKGWNDLAFGLKAHLLDNAGWVPSMGFLLHLSTPTGTNNYSANSYDPTVKWLNDWELPAGFSLGTNVGFDVPQDAGGRLARFLYAAAVGHDLPFISESLRMFAEIQGASPVQSPEPDERTFDTGLTFLVTGDIQLDTFVQIGLTRATTDVATGLGFSWRML
ncbi:MAG: transporter [Deltaproteobacteria bacterium]|nr:transporter [Deltaproteobacteria bacterium]